MISFLQRSNHIQGDAHEYRDHTSSNKSHNICSKDELPFAEFLPTDVANKYLSEITYRNRVFTPELTLFGFYRRQFFSIQYPVDITQK